MRWVMIWAALTGSAMADGERAGSFDYYVMALSWSPSFCATTGDAKEREQCAPGQHRGWVLHGLWPQYERGWPANCATTEPGPSRRQTEAMADIMGSSGLAWYQWKKHGRCSGLSAQAYFARARDAYESVAQPEVLQRLDRPVKLPASVIEEAWIAANSALAPDMVTVTCQSGRIMETRICLTKELEPRPCGSDSVKDCTARDALVEPIR